VQQISILARGRKAEYVLQWLYSSILDRKSLDLRVTDEFMSDGSGRLRLTILREASAKLIKVAGTSSPPAASSAAPSHSERTVPTSCA
jgi:hypothetical protein